MEHMDGASKVCVYKQCCDEHLSAHNRSDSLQQLSLLEFLRYAHHDNGHFPENILHIILVYYNIFITYNIYILTVVRGFLSGSAGKEPTFQYRRCKRLGVNPWVRKISWRRKWQLTPVFLPGEFHGQRNLAGYSPWVAKSRSRQSN